MELIVVECNLALNNKFLICRVCMQKKKFWISRKNWVGQETINQPYLYFGLNFLKRVGLDYRICLCCIYFLHCRGPPLKTAQQSKQIWFGKRGDPYTEFIYIELCREGFGKSGPNRGVVLNGGSSFIRGTTVFVLCFVAASALLKRCRCMDCVLILK